MSHRFGNCLARSLYILYFSYFAVHYSTIAVGLSFTLSFPVLLYSIPLGYPLYSAYFSVYCFTLPAGQIFTLSYFYSVLLLLCSYSLWSGLPYPTLSFSSQFPLCYTLCSACIAAHYSLPTYSAFVFDALCMDWFCRFDFRTRIRRVSEMYFPFDWVWSFLSTVDRAELRSYVKVEVDVLGSRP